MNLRISNQKYIHNVSFFKKGKLWFGDFFLYFFIYFFLFEIFFIQIKNRCFIGWSNP